MRFSTNQKPSFSQALLPCDATVRTLRGHARLLVDSFPLSTNEVEGRVGRRLPHWLTQMYFLSSTDASGYPLNFDYVGRIEDAEIETQLCAALAVCEAASGRTKQKNQGGAANLKQALAAWVASDREVVCGLCEVYAQDYVCLGYPLPDICAGDACLALS